MSYSLAPIDIISMGEIQRHITYGLHQVRQFLNGNLVFATRQKRLLLLSRVFARAAD